MIGSERKFSQKFQCVQEGFESIIYIFFFCINQVLDQIANEDAVPYIIAEIPTNPRVEVPDLIKLRNVLSKIRQTAAGKTAIDPVFVLDQTFCPNKHFLGKDWLLEIF